MAKIAVVLFAFVAIAAAAVLPEEPVPILAQEQQVNPDGSFHTKFETGNGIAYQEDGTFKDIGEGAAVVSQGSSSYTAPDGSLIKLDWVADENGFQPRGDHLPVAPPAPELPASVIRALEWIAAHPYVEPENEGRTASKIAVTQTRGRAQ